jgi:hypothetical protein
MLENFAIIGLIHLALPLARIIWMRRDPVDTCLSCFTAAFADVPYACDLGELGRYYLSCEKMRRHWGTVLPAGAHMSLTQGLRVSPRPRDGIGAKPLPPRRRCSPSNLRFRVRNGTQDAFIISEL